MEPVPLENWHVKIDGVKCYATFQRYRKPMNIAIFLNEVDTDETYVRVTINDGNERADDRILVKDYSENIAIPAILQEAGLIGRLISDGPYAEYALLLKPKALISKEEAKKLVK